MRNPISRKPSAPMVVAMTALVASFTAPAVADEVAKVAQSITSSSQIKNGTISGADIKNESITTTDLLNGSVQTSDIGTGQVQTADLGADSVRGDKIQSNTIDTSDVQDDSLTGNDINESLLGKVASASRADSAGNADTVGGRSASDFLSAGTVVKVDARLQPGQSKVIAKVGAVAVTAQCRDESGSRYTELVASTTKANAYLDGDDTFNGGTTADDFLQPDTPEDDRVMFYDSTSTGDDEPYLSNDIDQAYVVGPDGEYIGIDGETLAIGYNALGAECTAIGTAVVFG